MLFHFLSFVVFALSVAAWLQPSGTVDVNASPPQPQSTTCGDIVSANLFAGQLWYFALDAINCLTSVEFLPDVATRFITYYSQNVQFQSTLAYLKNPPDGYMQPGVDFATGLRHIQDNVNNGVYRNQYTFEADLQSLINRVHDGHFSLFAGVTNQFTFGSPYDIVSVSKDGKQTPQIYFFDELQACGGQPSCDAVPIRSINGVAAADYLTAFAANQSNGYLEPHADWNNLMRTPALDILGSVSLFSGAANLYPGDDLIFEYENGTTVNTNWLALYNSPGYTGPLDNGGDFYNFFVLGLLPASYNYTGYLDTLQQMQGTGPSSSNSSVVSTNASTPSMTSWNSVSTAYPSDTLVHQRDLGLFEPGVVNGYLLKDINTAVLSIPTFDEYGDGIDTFSSAVARFFDKTEQTDHVIIDLQQNYGGQVSLALDTFRLFFPNNLPFTGSRMRAQNFTDALGTTLNSQFTNPTSDVIDFDDLVASEWVVTDRINAATGQNFTSWAQYYGPLAEHGDFFTLVQQYNLSSTLFDDDNLGILFPNGTFNTSLQQDTAQWDPKDIVILTDGLCASACSLFVEMMTQIAGVRTIVVGGRPGDGPMQAASGTRGAADYDSYDLDDDINTAASINATAAAQLPPRGNGTDPGMYITYLGFNLRDQIRENATTPNQFLYLPASCRIYWSFANWSNYTRLWTDVHDAIYGDGSLCVPGSTDVPASSASNTTAVQRRSSDPFAHISDHILHGLGIQTAGDSRAGQGVSDSGRSGYAANDLVDCGDRDNNPDPSKCTASNCVTVFTPCRECREGRNGRETCRRLTNKRNLCLNSCTTTSAQGGNCGPGTHCVASHGRNTNLRSTQNFHDPGGLAPANVVAGTCQPTPASRNPTCGSLKRKTGHGFGPAMPRTSSRPRHGHKHRRYSV